MGKEEKESKKRAKLFEKLREMTPEQIDAYANKLEDARRAVEERKEKFRRCSHEMRDLHKVIELARRVQRNLAGKWCAHELGVGNHPTVFRVKGLRVGVKDGESFNVLEHGDAVLTPDQWFRCNEVYVDMFQFVPRYSMVPTVFTTATFGAGDLCKLENFIRELCNEFTDKCKTLRIDIDKFKAKLRSDRDDYIKNIDGSIMGYSLDAIKGIFKELGI
jgi:hypothetical protein